MFLFLSFIVIYSSADYHAADSLSFSSQRDDHRVRVVVCVADLHVFKDVSMSFVICSSSDQQGWFKILISLVCCTVCQQEVKQQDFFVGTVRVNGRMDWPMLDSAVSQAFKVSRSLLTNSFSVTCPRTERTVSIVLIHDSAVTLNLACSTSKSSTTAYWRKLRCRNSVRSHAELLVLWFLMYCNRLGSHPKHCLGSCW